MYKVLEKITAETPRGEIILEEEQIIKLSTSEAIPLIEAGLIIPTEKVAYKVYSNLLGCHFWLVKEIEDKKHLCDIQNISEAVLTEFEIKKLKDIKEVFPESNIKGINPFLFMAKSGNKE
jgi:hypothetical protein